MLKIEVRSFPTLVDGHAQELLLAVLPPGPEGGSLLMVGSVQLECDGRWASVCRLYVDQRYRRQGIARRLMGHAIRAACDAECETLALNCRKDNAAALGLYDKLGFVVGPEDEQGNYGLYKRLD